MEQAPGPLSQGGCRSRVGGARGRLRGSPASGGHALYSSALDTLFLMSALQSVRVWGSFLVFFCPEFAHCPLHNYF